MFCSSFKWAAWSLVQRVLIGYVWPSGCPRLREVVKLVWDHLPDEGEPVVAALSQILVPGDWVHGCVLWPALKRRCSRVEGSSAAVMERCWTWRAFSRDLHSRMSLSRV